TFLQEALRRGLQALPAPEVVTDAAQAEAAGVALPEGGSGGSEIARRDLTDLAALQLDDLTSLDARLLAGRAIAIARANLRVAASRGTDADEAVEAFDRAVEELTDAVVALA